MADEDTAVEIAVLSIARKQWRSRRRPVVVNWYRRPMMSLGWPLYTTNLYLN